MKEEPIRLQLGMGGVSGAGSVDDKLAAPAHGQEPGTAVEPWQAPRDSEEPLTGWPERRRHPRRRVLERPSLRFVQASGQLVKIRDILQGGLSIQFPTEFATQLDDPVIGQLLWGGSMTVAVQLTVRRRSLESVVGASFIGLSAMEAALIERIVSAYPS